MDPAPAPIKQKILSFFSAKPRHRFSLKEIQRGVGQSPREVRGLLDALRELAREGRLVRLKKHHYALPGGHNMMVGKIQAHPDGFGFLIPEEQGREDVYLNRREMRRVMHGDRVLVRIDTKKRGRTETHIVHVLERGQKRIIGTYEQLEGKGYLSPMDPRINRLLQLNAGMPTVEKGNVIAAEIVRYGTALSPPEAKFVEVLGDPDDPGVQAHGIIFRYGLPAAFSVETRRYAASCPRTIDPKELESRVDLRSLPTVTIDGEYARDFDDAVSIQRKNNLYRLYVSIADVAHYVKPEAAFDQDAYQRGTSVYFPDRVLPMLPEELSNGICSLNPGEDRLAKTVLLEIDGKGEVQHADFLKATIRSHARVTYTDVRRILVDRDQECVQRYRDLVEYFRLMEELTLLLWENRKARGSLDFDLPEAEIILDLQGMPENIVRAERSIAHRIIEEFMIAANEAVARHLTERGFPLLYRVHEKPEEDTLEALAPFLLSLGYRLPLKKGMTSPKDIQGILESCRGKPEERVLNRVLLRSMKQACYAPKNIGHFGLASSCYTHFTSPIRRYPDLIVHRILGQTMEGKRLKPKEKDDLIRRLEEAGRHTSERERIAMDAEREMVDLKKAQFMMDKIGQEFAGFIIDLAPFGFFVELESYFVEGLVHVNSLTDDSYQYYEKEHLIKGRRHGRTFRLGDTVRIKVDRIKAFRSEIDFKLVSS
ncbi:MAG: ribonuclease R [Candidatus Binatia bacterium]